MKKHVLNYNQFVNENKSQEHTNEFFSFKKAEKSGLEVSIEEFNDIIASLSIEQDPIYYEYSEKASTSSSVEELDIVIGECIKELKSQSHLKNIDEVAVAKLEEFKQSLQFLTFNEK